MPNKRYMRFFPPFSSIDPAKVKEAQKSRLNRLLSKGVSKNKPWPASWRWSDNTLQLRWGPGITTEIDASSWLEKRKRVKPSSFRERIWATLPTCPLPDVEQVAPGRSHEVKMFYGHLFNGHKTRVCRLE